MNNVLLKRNIFIVFSIILLLCISFGLITTTTFGVKDEDVTIYKNCLTTDVVYDNCYNLYNENNLEIKNTTNLETNTKYVYLGGMPLGIDVKCKGLYITSKQEVVTKKGTVMPCKDIDIKQGDVLESINGVQVLSERDIAMLIRGKESVTLSINRNNCVVDYEVNPAIDVLTGTEKLGLWLKDGVTGIGTLTYINENRRYGALGHPIEENKTYRYGNIYSADINGVVKGQRGKAGELNGTIDGSKTLGTIDKNTTFGIFGTYKGDLSAFERVEIASRNEIKPGKAYIYTTIKGNKPVKYEIEIIKKNQQNKAQNKGMVLRITDKRLLDKTNGILQGMSGSPIIQNNKLIGAVTHVFINDPTKGYGIYLDFMINN